MVLRGRHARARTDAAALDAHARLPRLLARAGGPARRGAPQFPAARAAGERGAAAGGRHRASRWPSARDLHARAPASPGDARSITGPVPPRAGGWWWQGATSATPRSARPRRRSARPPAGRCWRTRSRARGAGMRRWHTTTRCCVTARSPRASRPTSCCASATCPPPSPCAGGWRNWATFRRRSSSRRAAGRIPTQRSAGRFALEPARGAARAGGETRAERRPRMA